MKTFNSNIETKIKLDKTYAIAVLLMIDRNSKTRKISCKIRFVSSANLLFRAIKISR